MLVEVACFNKEDAIIAYENGANRIEFCSNYSVGGVSPSLDDVDFVLERVHIPVTVMLRPKAGPFVYYEDDETEMIKYLHALHQMPVDGVVFGIAYTENWIDNLKFWLQRIHPFDLTFHRALEDYPNQLETINQLQALGVRRVLTGGSSLGVMHHLSELIHLMDHAPKEIEIILGGGIRANDIVTLKEYSQIQWIHTACFDKSKNRLDQQELQKLIRLSSVAPE